MLACEINGFIINTVIIYTDTEPQHYTVQFILGLLYSGRQNASFAH